MNLSCNEDASLAQFQPLISSSWNNWQARWLKPRKKEDAEEQLLAFQNVCTRNKTTSDKPRLSPGLQRAFPKAKKNALYWYNGRDPHSRFDCFLAWTWKKKSISINPFLTLNVGGSNASHPIWKKSLPCKSCWLLTCTPKVFTLRAGSILSFFLSFSQPISLEHFLQVESNIMGWSWWTADLW